MACNVAPQLMNEALAYFLLKSGYNYSLELFVPRLLFSNIVLLLGVPIASLMMITQHHQLNED